MCYIFKRFCRECLACLTRIVFNHLLVINWMLNLSRRFCREILIFILLENISLAWGLKSVLGSIDPLLLLQTLLLCHKIHIYFIHNKLKFKTEIEWNSGNPVFKFLFSFVFRYDFSDFPIFGRHGGNAIKEIKSYKRLNLSLFSWWYTN